MTSTAGGAARRAGGPQAATHTGWSVCRMIPTGYAEVRFVRRLREAELCVEAIMEWLPPGTHGLDGPAVLCCGYGSG